ncbi:saccharopepsin [Gaeumannomyces tritici R3-111a-1]|uniref:Saccharopepsin n=1 Tax=Gaeumannomyces tritici (strain R3-111a-1) TaxID=644352 RepID=J3PG64_GAET3|nr:saccharopepsin [Gaeumannomyces tritici R3-111a-1]EJT70318.1 saccharopepsin [Gaeumannomyces tritici R3-111a-1]
MRSSQLLAIVGLSALASAAARVRTSNPSPRHDEGQPGVLKTSVRRVKTPESRRSLSQARYLHAAAMHARQVDNSSAPLPANVSNILYGYEYIMDVQVGTPPQNVSLIFDTGSDETWVNPECDAFSHQAVCFAAGRYNASDSTTSQNLSAPFSITYGSGSVEGWYFRDSFAIAGKTASAVQFGMAKLSYNMDAGILGLGYDSVVLDELKGQGVVESKDFSISLGNSVSAQGQAVFGGVDTAKFSGQLQAIPMLETQSFFSESLHYQVNLTYMGVTSKGSCESTAATDESFWGPAIVDTGSTISHLPFDAANLTAAMIPGARFDSYLQLWKVSCHYADSADTVDFGFGDVVVNIPIREFIWRNIPGGGQCFLGMVGDADSIGVSVLGDSFLRALMALYQPDLKLLHLAPFSDCGTDIVPTTEDGVDALEGMCEQPKWDTCTYRPAPVPLTVSSDDWSTLSWVTATPTEEPPLASETDGFTTMMPLPVPLSDGTVVTISDTVVPTWPAEPSVVVEPFPTETPVDTWSPGSILTDIRGSATARKTKSMSYHGTATAAMSAPGSLLTVNIGCHPTSFCVLALSTDEIAGVTANEECITYSTCDGGPGGRDPTPTSTGWGDDTTVADPIPTLTRPYVTPIDATGTGRYAKCTGVVYVTVTTTVGDLVPGDDGFCTARQG